MDISQFNVGTTTLLAELRSIHLSIKHQLPESCEKRAADCIEHLLERVNTVEKIGQGLRAQVDELFDFAKNVAGLDDRLLLDTKILKQWRDDARRLLDEIDPLDTLPVITKEEGFRMRSGRPTPNDA